MALTMAAIHREVTYVTQTVRLGCKRDARKALRGELERLSHGAYRDVYINADRTVVYKVGQYRGAFRQNEREAQLYADAVLAGKADHIAPCTAWRLEHEFEESQEHPVRSGDTCEVQACEKFGQRNGEYYTVYHYYVTKVTASVVVTAMVFLPRCGADLYGAWRDGNPYGEDGETPDVMPDYDVPPSDEYKAASAIVKEVAEAWGFSDMHDWNWRVDDTGHVYITDYADYH